jgi:transposase-like protein
VDKSGANLSAIQSISAEDDTPFELRRVKYLNNIVEQNQCAIKRIINP